MATTLGWLTGLAALAVGWRTYGWPGAALAFSAIVFWLLLQFNRSVRVMQAAAASPVGTVGSAVMLNAKLRVGLPMLEVVDFTKSLGRQMADAPETWTWADASGAQVVIAFKKGRCSSWALQRPQA